MKDYGSGLYDHEAVAIAVDSIGNVYASGRLSPGGWSSVFTVKLSADGTELWTRQKNTVLTGSDYSQDMAVDSLGNVYVASSTYSGDILTVKYDAAGVEKWAKTYAGGSAAGISLDVDGNVYVAGEGNGGFLTLKYNPAGKLRWAKTYGGGGRARDVVTDANGNVYVTGEVMGANLRWQYGTIKYSANGNQIWVNRYSGTAPETSAYTLDMVADSAGNVIVTGTSQEVDAATNMTTIKYGSNGETMWVNSYNAGGATPYNEDNGYALAVDELDNVYVAGSGQSGLTGSYDFAVVKYDSGGNVIWTQRHEYLNNYGGDSSPMAISVSSSGVYVSGRTGRSSGSFDLLKIAR